MEAFQLSGPDWMSTAFFDIAAKLPDGATRSQVPEMLQSLLTERFRLAIRHQPQETAVYALLVGKNGPKMKEAGPGAGQSRQPLTAGPGDRMNLIVMPNPYGGANTISLLNRERAVFESEKASMTDLIVALKRYVDAPLVDKTGLTGTYEIGLDVPKNGVNAGRPGMMGDAAGSADGVSDPDTSIFSSIQKLGLRLERQKIVLDHIVVDHVERLPIEN